MNEKKWRYRIKIKGPNVGKSDTRQDIVRDKFYFLHLFISREKLFTVKQSGDRFSIRLLQESSMRRVFLAFFT